MWKRIFSELSDGIKMLARALLNFYIPVELIRDLDTCLSAGSYSELEALKMTRPTGVTIVAVLRLIGGVFALLVGLVGFLIMPELAKVDADWGPRLMVPSLFLTAYGVFILIYGYGLWNLKGWGWLFAVMFEAAVIISNSTVLLVGEDFMEFSVPKAIRDIVISSLILFYLCRPTVKRAFWKA